MIDASTTDDEDDDDNSSQKKPKEEKGSKLRSLLGLDQDRDGSDEKSAGPEDDDSFFQHEEDSEPDDQDPMGQTAEHDGADEEVDKQVKFIPGMRTLEEKIRSTLNERKTLGDRNLEDLTPWEKYQMKRKEKRKEKKSQSKELREAFKNETRGSGSSAHPESKVKRRVDAASSTSAAEPSSKGELDLLLAGDDGTYIFIYYRNTYRLP